MGEEYPLSVSDALKFYHGERIIFAARRRWYARLWRWLTRYGKRHPSPVATVTDVDYKNGIVTIRAL